MMLKSVSVSTNLTAVKERPRLQSPREPLLHGLGANADQSLELYTDLMVCPPTRVRVVVSGTPSWKVSAVGANLANLTVSENCTVTSRRFKSTLKSTNVGFVMSAVYLAHTWVR